MAERQANKPEIAGQKRTIKLAPAIGDWTTYRPPKILVKKVKSGLYGFDRLSKEELNLVLLLHYHFIENFLKQLKIDLKLGVEFYSAQVEQTTYLNFLRTLNSALVQSKVTIDGLNDPVSFFVDLHLANTLINYSLGSHDIEPINRGLTEAEGLAFSALFTEYLPNYSAAFDEIFETAAFSMMGSPDITIDPSINTSATFVVFGAEVLLADNPPGKILIGYSGNTLKTLLERYHQKEKGKVVDFSRLLPLLLSRITIPTSITLGQTTLTTGEIQRLETGDVVSLESSINSAIQMSIGKKLKLFGQPGIKDKKVSLRVAGMGEEGMLIAPPTMLEEKKAPEKKAEEIPAAPAEIEAPTPLPKESEELPEEKEENIFEEFPEEDTEEEYAEEEFPEEEYAEEESPEEEFPAEASTEEKL